MTEDKASFTINSELPVSIHPYPKAWQSPFVAGFQFAGGVCAAIFAGAMAVRVLRLIWGWLA